MNTQIEKGQVLKHLYYIVSWPEDHSVMSNSALN